MKKELYIIIDMIEELEALRKQHNTGKSNSYSMNEVRKEAYAKLKK